MRLFLLGVLAFVLILVSGFAYIKLGFAPVATS